MKAPIATLQIATPADPPKRGFALECGVAMRLASTPLGGNTSPLLGTVFAGYKRGRTIFGVGLQLSATHVASTFGLSTSSGTIVTLLVVPGLRTTLVRTRGSAFEMALDVDLGIGRLFGSTGAGADTALGLPPGSSVVGEDLRVFVAVGPVARYFIHPHLAVESLLLARTDFIAFETNSTARRIDVDFNVMLGLRLLAVF